MKRTLLTLGIISSILGGITAFLPVRHLSIALTISGVILCVIAYLVAVKQNKKRNGSLFAIALGIICFGLSIYFDIFVNHNVKNDSAFDQRINISKQDVDQDLNTAIEASVNDSIIH